MSLKRIEKKEPGVQIKSNEVKTSVDSETQGKRNELKSRELPSRSALPSDQCISRWNKLKALREQNRASNFESIYKLSAEERAIWKSSKLTPNTLSSIDGIRSAKKGNSSQTSGVTREYSSGELHLKNMTTNPGATSPKRPSSQSSGAVPAAKQSEWKLLKSKLSLLRKKGNKDMSGNCAENTIMGKDIKEVNTGTGIGKHEKSAQLSSISPIESILSKKSNSSEEKGIICKKEDLWHLISEASKGAKLMKTKSFNSEEEDTNELCASTSAGSPTPSTSASADASTSADVSIKRNSLKKQHSCGSESSCDREDNNKTKQSNTRTECLDSCQPENAHKNQYKTKANKEDSFGEKSVGQNSRNDNSDQNESESRLKNKNKSSVGSKGKPINESNLANSETDSTTHNDGHNEDNETGANVPAVQWDDINFVDPSLLGDAIQTFLQGLASGSGSGSSSSGTTTNEKRVSFKKSF